MIRHQDIWLPDGEAHLQGWMTKHGEIVDGKGTYQIKKLRAALEFVTDWDTAVDIGAHVGLWSMHLAKKFRCVHAYEPVEEFRNCFALNVPGDNVIMHGIALGASEGYCTMKRTPGSTGDTCVADGDDTKVTALDLWPFDKVGFIKIDCEGYEREVLLGAEATVRGHRPVICVEQKPHVLARNYKTVGRPAVTLLEEWGYVIRREIGGDYILTHE